MMSFYPLRNRLTYKAVLSYLLRAANSNRIKEAPEHPVKHLSAANRRLLTYFLLIALPACGEPIAPPTPVAAVKVSPETSTLVPGASVTLTAAPQDAEGKPLTRAVTWTSSDAAVASVAAGVVTAIAPGSAVISATASGTTGTAPVVVKEGGLLVPTGGTVSGMNGQVTVSVPAGAVTSQAQLVVEPASNPAASPRLVAGTAFSFDAGSIALVQPVTISVKYDPARLTSGAPESGLKLYLLTGDKWQRVVNSTVDATADRVSASVTAFGTYAILEQAPATAAIGGGNNQSAQVASPVAIPPFIKVVDSDGFPVPGLSVQFAIGSGGGTLTGGSATTNADGNATVGSWTLGATAGTNTLTASVQGASGGPFTFSAVGVAGPANKLVLTTSPSEIAQSGIVLARQPVVQVTDVYGNATTTTGLVITAAITNGAGSLSGLPSQPTNNLGLATFSGLAISGTAGVKTLTFSASGLAPAGASVTLTAGTASRLSLIASPTSAPRNRIAFPQQPAVELQDASGNAVTQSGVIVTASIVSGGGALSGTTTAVTDARGIAIFSDLALAGTVGPRILGFAAPGVTVVTTGVTLTAGNASSIAANAGNGQSANVGSTLPTAPAVRIADADGNPVAGVLVSFAVTGGDGSITVPSSTSDASGVARVGSWTLGTKAGSNTLSATSAGLAGSPVTFTATGTAGAPGKLAFATSPSASPRNRIVFAEQPAIQVEDSNGNPVAQAGIVVTASLASGGGTLLGTTAVPTDSRGIATFTNLAVAGTVGSRTIVFGSAGTASLSFSVNLLAGTATSISINAGNGQTARAGSAVPIAPSVLVRDTDGNAVSGVTVVFTPASGSGSVTGASAQSDNLGVATVGSWTLAAVVGAQELNASSPAIAGQTASFTATATAAAGIPFTISISSGNGQAARAGTAVPVAPSVIVRDVDSNPVGGVTVTFVPAAGSGTVTSATAVTNSAGVAVVGSWTLGSAIGTQTLTATTPALPGQSVSFTATSTPAGPASIIVVSGSGQFPIAGRGVREYIVFRVVDGDGIPFAGAQVNFSVPAGHGTLSVTSATTLSDGLAVVKGWTLGPGEGTQTVTATVAGLADKSALVSVYAVPIRIVTFGDSNTDYGYVGNSSILNQVSYVSANPRRPSPSLADNFTQLSGKIEIWWSDRYSPAVNAVNHGVLGTGSGAARSTDGAPGARTIVNGITRFGAEVLGLGAPWNGGEPTNASFQSGPVTRSLAYTPTGNDFVYVSIGTNDGNQLISTAQTLENLEWMIDSWTGAGMRADHFILTNLAPGIGFTSLEADRNRAIRSLAVQKGVSFIDITSLTSNDDGITWKSAALHVGDEVHYSETVREWIAEQIVSIMAAATRPIE